MIVALAIIGGLAFLYLSCCTVVLSFKALNATEELNARLDGHFPQDLQDRYRELTQLELVERIIGEE